MDNQNPYVLRSNGLAVQKWADYAKHSSLCLFLTLVICINPTVLVTSSAYPCYLTLIGGITMDTDVENAFYVHNRHDELYMKYMRCPRTSLYTYVVEEGKENDVLIQTSA